MIRKALFSTLLALSCFSLLFAEEHLLDFSQVTWTGAMPAKSHYGNLTPQNVTVNLSDSGHIKSFKLILNMESIDIKDINPGKDREKLTKHLKSKDFFYVSKHPTSTFSMSKYEKGIMIGEIEIRGIKKPISIPVSVVKNVKKGWTLSGKFTFDRQLFNVNYQNSGWFGAAKDKLIYDDVEISYSLAFIKKE